MVDEKQIASLTAETLAMQFLLTNVLLQLGKLDPILQSAIKRGLDNAADGVEDLASHPGAVRVSPDLIAKALRVIEDTRAVLVGDDGPSLAPTDAQ